MDLIDILLANAIISKKLPPAILNLKGSVSSTSELPLTGNKKGDVWAVTANNSEWVWMSDNGSGSFSDYEDFGTFVDLSPYRTASDQDIIDSGKQSKVTATGILKGDGNGGVSAAVAGTDYDTASNVVSATAAMTPAQAAQTRQNIGADTPETVAAWLDEHVDPETGYVIDDTLTIQGAAADAKATGDAVGELKNALTEITGCEIIRLNSGEYYNTSGTTVNISSPSPNSGWDSVAVECSAGDVFYVTGHSGSAPRLWAFAELDGTILDPRAIASLTGDKLKITAPTNAAYLVVNADNSYARELTKGQLLVDRVADNANAVNSVFVTPESWDDFVVDLVLRNTTYEKLGIRQLYVNYNSYDLLIQFAGLSNGTWTPFLTYERASAPTGRPDVELIEFNNIVKGKILLDWTKAPSTLNFGRSDNPLVIKDQCRALEESAEDPKNDVIKQVTDITGCTVIATVDGVYYATNGTDVTPGTNSSWTSAKVPCEEGDIFTITGAGGSSPRLWAFAKSDGKIITPQAIADKTETREIHIAPVNAAYFVVNMLKSFPHELFSGVPVNEKMPTDGYENKDNIRQKVIVDANGNGDFTTLGAAYAAITDSSIFNQYEIIVLPGEYQEQYLTPPPYTHTHGIKAESTIITSVGLEYDSLKNDWLSVFELRNSCKLSNLTVISGTKYCIHEDNFSLSRQTIVCRNMILHQTRAHQTSAIGNGTQFGGTKYIFSNCTIINGSAFTHSNTRAESGSDQHTVFDSCKFVDSALVLSSVATSLTAIEGNYVCEINNCTFNPANGSVVLRFGSAITGMSAPNFPWNLCGAGNEGVDITFDNTDDTRYTDAWDSVNLIEKTYVKVAESVTKGQYVDASGVVTTSDADKYGQVLANTSSNEYAPILRVK